jgi:D-aminopeptidase
MSVFLVNITTVPVDINKAQNSNCKLKFTHIKTALKTKVRELVNAANKWKPPELFLHQN